MSYLDDIFGPQPKKKRSRKREPTPAQEYYQTGKNMYNMGKGIASSPAASFIKKKIKSRMEKREHDKLFKNYSSTKINLGTSRVGSLKPNKNELKQLKGNSRIRYY